MKGINERKQELIKRLYEKKQPIYRAIAKELSRPTRKAVAVNLAKIEKHAKDKEYVIVPGKVLGNGNLKKDVTVIAYSFSRTALQKLKKKMTISELLEKNIKGLRIIK